MILTYEDIKYRKRIESLYKLTPFFFQMESSTTSNKKSYTSYDLCSETCLEEGKNTSDWAWNTLYIFFKEYIAVVLQIVLFKRLDLPDFLTAAFITYVLLVSLGFPFINSYLFFLLRLGPWTTSKNTPGIKSLMKNLFQIVIVITAHLLAARTAADFLKSHETTWETSHIHEIMNQGQNTSFESTISWNFYGSDENVNVALPGIEEALNSFLFLIGLLNIMEADFGEAMSSAYWNEKPTQKGSTIEVKNDKLLAEITATRNLINEQTKNIQEKLEEIKTQATVPPIKPLRTFIPLPNKSILSNVNATQNTRIVSLEPVGRRMNGEDIFTHHSAIPITFILHVCILIAAISRMFPTAHGTPAITMYLYLREYCSGEVATSRVMGGSIGALMALLYYYIYHVWAGRYQSPIPEKFVQSIIVREPAYLYSELQLPKHMSNKMNSE
jgi:hypothetical protein